MENMRDNFLASVEDTLNILRKRGLYEQHYEGVSEEEFAEVLVRFCGGSEDGLYTYKDDMAKCAEEYFIARWYLNNNEMTWDGGRFLFAPKV